MDEKEKLKEMARPKLDIVVANLELLQDEALRTNALLDEIKRTVECFKKEHRSHRGWGKKVTIITLLLAVSMATIEVQSGGELKMFSTAWTYLKGVLL